MSKLGQSNPETRYTLPADEPPLGGTSRQTVPYRLVGCRHMGDPNRPTPLQLLAAG